MVVSPLISLMEDQVRASSSLRLGLVVVKITSMVNSDIWNSIYSPLCPDRSNLLKGPASRLALLGGRPAREEEASR